MKKTDSNNLAPKTKVAVLYGGRSSEHEVSLVSAANVIQNLDRSRFDVVPIGINKQGTWFLGEDTHKQIDGMPEPLQLQQDLERILFTPNYIGKQPVSQVRDLLPHLKNSERLFDVVFPAIHGPLCEDGVVQGLLELADVPYVGCGVLASAICMDKDMAKRLVKDAGVKIPPYIAIDRGHWDRRPAEYCALVAEQLAYPVFVKPANAGSSVGIRKVKYPDELMAAINYAFLYDTKVLVEAGINAMELEISVLESKEYGADPIVSVVGEIRPQNGHEFYSYAAKYLDEHGAALIIPAPIPTEIQEEAAHIAKTIFAALNCEGMARVDLFLEKETNQIYFNEINTIPGFTQISMYPKLMTASGISYANLLTHLVDLAIDRHARKRQLSRDCVAD